MTDEPNQDAPLPSSTTPAPASSETAADQPRPQAKGKAPFISGVLGGAVGGVIVLTAALGGIAAFWPDVREIVLADDYRRLALLERAIDDLNPRLVAIERELSRRGGEAETVGLAQTLAQRVATLESQVHAPLADPRVGALAEQSERLASDVSRLGADLQSLRGAIPPEGTILRLAERAESAEKAVRDISAQRASAQATLLVIGQLRDAVDRGDPYAYELQALRRVLGEHADASGLDALAPYTEKGVRRKDALIDAWPGVAKAALDAAIAPPSADFWQRTLAKLTSLVSIRKIDGQGDSAQAIVARAENRIGEGDLARAVQELGHLDGAPANAAAVWTRDAGARVAADRALSELSAMVAAQTAKSGG